MNINAFIQIDNLLGKLVSAKRAARQTAELFTEALTAHDTAAINRWQAELNMAYDHIHKLEVAIMAI